MRAILNIVYHETFHNKHMWKASWWKEKEKRKIIKSWSDSVKEMGKPKSMSKKAKKLAKKKGMYCNNFKSEPDYVSMQ